MSNLLFRKSLLVSLAVTVFAEAQTRKYKIQCQALSKGSEFEKVPGAGNPVGCQVGVANRYSELEKVSAVETFQNGPRKSARHWKSP